MRCHIPAFAQWLAVLLVGAFALPTAAQKDDLRDRLEKAAERLGPLVENSADRAGEVLERVRKSEQFDAVRKPIRRWTRDVGAHAARYLAKARKRFGPDIERAFSDPAMRERALQAVTLLMQARRIHKSLAKKAVGALVRRAGNTAVATPEGTATLDEVARRRLVSRFPMLEGSALARDPTAVLAALVAQDVGFFLSDARIVPTDEGKYRTLISAAKDQDPRAREAIEKAADAKERLLAGENFVAPLRQFLVAVQGTTREGPSFESGRPDPARNRERSKSDGRDPGSSYRIKVVGDLGRPVAGAPIFVSGRDPGADWDRTISQALVQMAGKTDVRFRIAVRVLELGTVTPERVEDLAKVGHTNEKGVYRVSAVPGQKIAAVAPGKALGGSVLGESGRIVLPRSMPRSVITTRRLQKAGRVKLRVHQPMTIDDREPGRGKLAVKAGATREFRIHRRTLGLFEMPQHMVRFYVTDLRTGERDAVGTRVPLGKGRKAGKGDRSVLLAPVLGSAEELSEDGSVELVSETDSGFVLRGRSTGTKLALARADVGPSARRRSDPAPLRVNVRFEEAGRYRVQAAVGAVTTEEGRRDWDRFGSPVRWTVRVKRSGAERSLSAGCSLVMVVDTSGSMGKQDKLPAVKSACERLAVLSDPGQLGLVGFADQSHTRARVGRAGSPRSDELRKAIRQLSSGGGTNIGAGLQQAMGQWQMGRDEPGAILLLSDGMNTEGDPADAVRQAIERGIAVYTIAYGSKANRKWLRKVAKKTGGESFRSGTDNVGAIFQRIRADCADQSTLARVRSVIRPRQRHRFAYRVPEGSGPSELVTDWAGSHLTVSLIDPSGRRYTPQRTPAGVEYHEDPERAISYYRIRDPRPGKWRAVVYADDVPRRGEAYEQRMSVTDGLRLFLDFERGRRGPSEPVTARVSAGSDVSVSRCVLYVADAGGDYRKIEAQAPGGKAGTAGARTARFDAPKSVGIYDVWAAVAGRRADGTRFTRRLRRSLVVGSPDQIRSLASRDRPAAREAGVAAGGSGAGGAWVLAITGAMALLLLATTGLGALVIAKSVRGRRSGGHGGRSHTRVERDHRATDRPR